MKTLLSYILTPLFYLAFGLVLVIFDPLQRITLKVFGHRAHDAIISVITGLCTNSTRILGASYKVVGRELLPDNRPLVFAANHQSMYDIPPIFWFFRKHHPKFVVKKELAKGIPTISYNIRNGGSVTIDRKNPKQAIPQIQKLGRFINEKKYAAVIYPEGTRSRSGEMRAFKPAGLVAPSRSCTRCAARTADHKQGISVYPKGIISADCRGKDGIHCSPTTRKYGR